MVYPDDKGLFAPDLRLLPTGGGNQIVCSKATYDEEKADNPDYPAWEELSPAHQEEEGAHTVLMAEGFEVWISKDPENQSVWIRKAGSPGVVRAKFAEEGIDTEIWAEMGLSGAMSEAYAFYCELTDV